MKVDSGITTGAIADTVGAVKAVQVTGDDRLWAETAPTHSCPSWWSGRRFGTRGGRVSSSDCVQFRRQPQQPFLHNRGQQEP